MSDYFQDEPQLPVPNTKGKKGLWIMFFVIGVIFLIIVFMKAGSSTKDPKKAVVDAANSDRIKTGEKTSESAQAIADQMISNDGTIQSQSGSVDSFLEKNIENNTKLANDEERLTNNKRVTRIDDRLPPSIDAHGHPTTTISNDHYVPNLTDKSEVKNITIPGFAENWDPEQEIIVPATSHTPAYRYRPAYLKGSNNPQRPDDLEQLDRVWLNSLNMPSYGHSIQVNNAFNENLPTVAIKQSDCKSQLIHVNGYKYTRQPVGQTLIKIKNKKTWTIPAPGESK
jgi:hypothetical protein